MSVPKIFFQNKADPSHSGTEDIYLQSAQLQLQNLDLLTANQLLRERIKELESLQDVFCGLIKTYDLDGTIQSTLHMATQITCSEAGFVMLGNNGFQSFKMISSVGDFNQSLQEYLQNNTCILRNG